MNERQRHILDAAVTWQRVLPLGSALGESLDSPRGRSLRNSCSSPTSLSGPQCIHESWTWAHWDAGRRDASAPWRTERLWHSEQKKTAHRFIINGPDCKINGFNLSSVTFCSTDFKCCMKCLNTKTRGFRWRYLNVGVDSTGENNSEHRLHKAWMKGLHRQYQTADVSLCHGSEGQLHVDSRLGARLHEGNSVLLRGDGRIASSGRESTRRLDADGCERITHPRQPLSLVSPDHSVAAHVCLQWHGKQRSRGFLSGIIGIHISAAHSRSRPFRLLSNT